MYVDSYALIVQRDGDGGDTLQREGMYAFGKWLRYNQAGNTVVIADEPARRDPAAVMDKLEVKPGIFVRHPDPNKWYSNPATTSRDQLVPVFAYCAAYEDYPRLWRLFKAAVKRGFFAQNTTRAGAGHKANKMPEKPSKNQRLNWHIEHSKNCTCRIPSEKLQAEIDEYLKQI